VAGGVRARVIFGGGTAIFELFFCKTKYLLVGASGMLWTGQWMSA